MDADDLQEQFVECVDAAITSNHPGRNPRVIARDTWNMLATFGLQLVSVGDDEQQTTVTNACGCQCFSCRNHQHHLCVTGCPMRPGVV